MYDNDFEPLSLTEKALLWSIIIGIFSIQAACWVWLGYQLAS